MADKLDNLEKRLSLIESRIYGEANKDASYPKTEECEKVIDTLASMNTKINTTITGRPKIQALLKRLGELEMVLDPGHMESASLSQDAKTEIILADEELIRQSAQNLEKVNHMTEVLGSGHIKDVPNLQHRLQELSSAHLSQQDKVTELSEETKRAIQHYNRLITLMSKQFVQWEEIMSSLELKSTPKAEPL